VISTASHRPEAIAAAAWRAWIMNEQLPTAVPSTQLTAAVGEPIGPNFGFQPPSFALGAQPGQTNPSGQRAAATYSTQAASSPKALLELELRNLFALVDVSKSLTVR
jgi:hypothetical protein